MRKLQINTLKFSYVFASSTSLGCLGC